MQRGYAEQKPVTLDAKLNAILVRKLDSGRYKGGNKKPLC
jgi:hypothetical protein